MSTEIATWNMIHAKILSFPPPTAGRGNECLTKAEILSLGGLYISITGNYGNSECVMLKDISTKEIIWKYTFIVSPTSFSFPAIGGTQTVSIASYKDQYIGGDYSGIRENVGFSSSPSEGWLSSGGTSVTASENTVTSRRTGSVTYTQHERGTIIPVSVWQDPAVVSIRTTVEALSNTTGEDWASASSREYVFSPYDTRIISFRVKEETVTNNIVTNSKYIYSFTSMDMSQSGKPAALKITKNYDNSCSISYQSGTITNTYWSTYVTLKYNSITASSILFFMFTYN